MDTAGIFGLYFFILFWFVLNTPVRNMKVLFVPPVPIEIVDLYALYKRIVISYPTICYPSCYLPPS